MRYVILGAGAIGGTLGGHLHRAGREVVLIARPAHAAAIRAGGLRLVTGDSDQRLPVTAVDSAAGAAPFGPGDAVLLTCKAQDTVAALGELRAAGAPRELPVVCCQNAIWNESHAQRVFTAVYGAVVFVPGVFLQPGEVINARTGHYGYLEVGRYPAGVDQLCATLVADLAAAGFAALLRQGSDDKIAFTDKNVKENYLSFWARGPGLTGFKSLTHICAEPTAQETLDVDHSKIVCPTMICWGLHDVWMPVESGRRLKEAIAGPCRLEVIERAGHYVLEDRPEAVADRIDDFVTEWAGVRL